MARRQPTLAEVALRQQVSAANRVAFRSWWDGGVPRATYWVLGLGAIVIVAGAVAWKFLA
jgi:hypothetical protein